MRNTMIGTVAILLVCGIAMAISFTDVDTTKHEGKTGLKDLITVLDANFAVIEGGAQAVNASSLGLTTNGVLSGSFSVIGTQVVFIAGGVTNVVVADITS